MKIFKKLSTIIIGLAISVSIFSANAFAAVNVVKDAKSNWKMCIENGGVAEFKNGEIVIAGSSGAATYLGKRVLEEEVTVRFRASLSQEWAAIFIRNNVNDEYIMAPDGGPQAFPWTGRGYPYMIGIRKNRIDISQCYTDSPNPKTLAETPEDKPLPIGDGKEHAISVKVLNSAANEMTVIVKFDGKEVLRHTDKAAANVPMKQAGYVSLACYSAEDTFTVTALEFPDGSVKLKKDPVPTKAPEKNNNSIGSTTEQKGTADTVTENTQTTENTQSQNTKTETTEANIDTTVEESTADTAAKTETTAKVSDEPQAVEASSDSESAAQEKAGVSTGVIIAIAAVAAVGIGTLAVVLRKRNK